MHALLISANDLFADTGGAAKTFRQFLAPMLEDGWDVTFYTHGSERETLRRDGFLVERVPGERPVDHAVEYVDEHRPDVVLTHAGWADVAHDAAAECDVPFVHCVRSVFDIQIRENFENDPQVEHVMTPSDFIAEKARDAYDCPVSTVYSPIDFDFYDVGEVNRDAITLINPIGFKGGFVFEALAERNPDREFLAKMGWLHFRTDDYSWDPEYFDIVSRALDGEAQTPDEPDLDALSNVEFVRTGDIRDIYRRTRVLLVPSQEPEAFGRVTLEAMYNGIPVVASNHGGLPEACGDAGILVDDYESVDAWERAVESLDDPERYEAEVAAGRQRGEEYRQLQRKEIERFSDVLETVAVGNA